MPQMIVRHRVADFNQWKKIFELAGPVRKLHGEKRYKVFRNTADTNDVVLLLEWADAQKALQYSQSEQLRDGMKKAGVLEDPVLYLSDEDLEK